MLHTSVFGVRSQFLLFSPVRYIEFLAHCINVEPAVNANSFPTYVIEGKQELVFEMEVVTYSNCKNLGLHIDRYD